jgi:hypothetical protein
VNDKVSSAYPCPKKKRYKLHYLFMEKKKTETALIQAP